MNLRKNVRSTRVFVNVSLFLIIIALLFFIIFGLRSFNLIRLPAFIEDIFYKEQEVKIPEKGDDGELLEYLQKQSGSADDTSEKSVPLVIEPDKLLEAVSQLNFTDCLNADCKAVFYDENGVQKREETVKLYKKGEKIRYLLSVDGIPQYLCINDTIREQTENLLTGKKVRNSVSSPMNLDKIPGVQSLESYLSPADGTIIESCAVLFEDEENIAQITLSVPYLSLAEKVTLSLDTGIVKNIESTSTATGKIVYVYSASVKEAYYLDQKINQTQITDALFSIE